MGNFDQERDPEQEIKSLEDRVKLIEDDISKIQRNNELLEYYAYNEKDLSTLIDKVGISCDNNNSGQLTLKTKSSSYTFNFFIDPVLFKKTFSKFIKRIIKKSSMNIAGRKEEIEELKENIKYWEKQKDGMLFQGEESKKSKK
jgi:hypothetical protein